MVVLCILWVEEGRGWGSVGSVGSPVTHAMDRQEAPVTARTSRTTTPPVPSSVPHSRIGVITSLALSCRLNEN